MDRWIGKVAIVTGASAGIGATIAQELVEAGVKVVGLGRRSERIEDLAHQLISSTGKLYAVKTDMTKENDIINAFQWTLENVGPVSILINNAGCGAETTLIDGDTNQWKRVFDVNVIGLCIATREAVKIMRAHSINGHIVHINSIIGHTVLPIPKFNVYPASKFSVTALAETLRYELRDIKSGIKITSISPGLTLTDESGNIPEEFLGCPHLNKKDVAGAVMYTLSTPPNVQVHEIIIKPLLDKF